MANVLAVIGLAFVTWIATSAVFQLAYMLEEREIKTNTNFFAIILNAHKYITGINWKDKMTPKSDIDKEIAEEEKEIAELERQKEKIDELAELKRRKERLFKDVHEETSSEYWKCPQCRREFKDLEGLNNHRAWEHRQ